MTLINPKYDYAKLTRATVEGKRKYQTPDGGKVSSVTTILDATKPEESQVALDNWRKRVGHQKAQSITTEAANRGTRMHKYLEDYVDTGIWPEAGSNPFAKQSHMMATIVKEQALSYVDEIWGSEVALYVPQIYAGTTDLVGIYKGNPAIMDFKQSNKIKKAEWIQDYYLQISLYIEAHNDMFGTDIKHGHIFMCVQDGTYQQFDLSPAPDPHFGRTYEDWRYIALDRVYQYYEKFSKK